VCFASRLATSRETSELEFKGTLPFQAQRGQPQTADRWIERGDRVGDYARDQILAELVAFANADGGTLILGLHETDDEPKEAARLEALPDCEGLAKRLFDATEDVVEPRLLGLQSRALTADSTAGSGYVILRVDKSPLGPHRLKTTRDFYVRRGERAAKMDVREIKDLTLELARSGDRIEALWRSRDDLARQEFERLRSFPEDGPVAAPLVIQVTGIPTAPLLIQDLASRQEIWWRGRGFTAMVDGVAYLCEYPVIRAA
jgi:hypothetical protein